MKPVTIAVSVKNPGFAKDLARGLAALERPYCIAIAEEEGEIPPESKWEVLVTDFDRIGGQKADFEPYRVVRVEEDTCRISQISCRIDAAARKYRDRNCDGTEYFLQKNICAGTDAKSTRTVIFQGFWGGAGVTSLALTAGRMLSGAYGERVLYLPFTDQDGSMIYRTETEAEDAEMGNGRELFYRMRNRRPCCFRDFVWTDYAGLDYLRWDSSTAGAGFMSDDERIQFLQLAAEQQEYDWIMVDLGTETLPAAGAVRVMVDSLQDSRTALGGNHHEDDGFSQEVQVLVRNRGLENRLEPACDTEEGGWQKRYMMELLDDGESFVTDASGKVELVLSKSYAAGVKIFSEWLLEIMGNRVELWR